MADSNRKFGLMSRKVVLGTTLGAALFFMIVGVIFWGGFNTAMEATNTMDFCISCHEMEDNVYREYTETAHFSNRSGVRATCSDCHVPDPWVHKVVRKVRASNELYHKVLGSIDTPEKFDGKRLQLAQNVWRSMKETDSRECRNCHDFASMNPENQKKRARKQHILGMEQGNTCIDCHKGVAHKKVHDQLSEEELVAMEQPREQHKRPVPPAWLAFIAAGGETAAADSEPAEPAEDKPATETAAAKPATMETAAAADTSAASGGGAPAAASGIDWAGIEAYPVTLFYPGQTSMEWMLKGSDHGGKRAFVTGDRCFECHEDEEVDIGELMISGEKAEETPIEGKRGSIVVDVRAAHDADNLYMQFQWEDVGEHVPLPFVDGGKMDPDNPVKLALMFATDDEENPKVEYAERSGCWQTCHHDLNYMPHQPGDDALSGPLASRLDLGQGFTKYLQESRSEIEIDGKNDAKRGGWDKLRDQAEIDAALADGAFMDLLRYKAGTGESEDGHILEQRVMSGGQGVSFSGGLADGVWTIEMVRKLVSDKPGDVSFAKDQLYNIGIAIHDDYTSSRFHHVSLGFKLGFDNDDAEINALGR